MYHLAQFTIGFQEISFPLLARTKFSSLIFWILEVWALGIWKSKRETTIRMPLMKQAQNSKTLELKDYHPLSIRGIISEYEPIIKLWTLQISQFLNVLQIIKLKNYIWPFPLWYEGDAVDF